jgi:hypothetical protein
MRNINKIAKTLLIIYILFISLFALDVFEEGFSFNALKGFIIHLIPTFIIILAGIIAWKNQKEGGMILILLGIIFSIFFHVNISSFLIISLPLIIIGSLFLWKKN